MSAPQARDLARRFLSQSLAAEGGELVLEHLEREAVMEALRSGRVPLRHDRSAAGEPRTGHETAASSPAAAAPLSDDIIAGASDLEALSRLVASCTRCALHQVRKNPVFGEGAADARVVCVGEAPGAREDETGRPFVGRAGALLDRLLVSIGLPRESVYICNVLKSRPPKNRDPLPDEVAACSPYLLRQLGLIEPEIIVAFGAFAARTLLDTKSALGRLRGRIHRYAGYPVVVTYHPAALLRNPGWTRPTWEDLQIVRRLLDGARVSGESLIG